MPRVRILLQARMDSTRLPGKVILPIRHIPLVVLAARRAQRSGYELVVITSQETSDDPLVQVLEEYEIPYFRGDKNDVLQRFIQATEDLADADILVRLTGDNVIPDGDLVRTYVKAYQQRQVAHFGILQGPENNAPYGMGLEVFAVKYIREAYQAPDLTQQDREHVTSWLGRNYDISLDIPIKNDNMPLPLVHPRVPHLRCTCDLLSDYYRLNRIFAKVDDPVAAPWQDLLILLAEDSYQEFPLPVKLYNGHPRSELVLGTAQLGMAYGITNGQGQPDFDQAQALLQAAINLGITSFDTAAGYGESEVILGKVLGHRRDYLYELISKYPPLNDQAWSKDYPVFRSLARLRQTQLSTYVLHRADFLKDSELMGLLQALKAEGYIQKLGVSVQNPAEMELALATEGIEHIQLPVNLLDWRWDEIFQKPKPPGLRIHARSVFLQGLLAQTQPEILPPGFEAEFKAAFLTLQDLAAQWQLNMKALAIGFVRALDWVDELVIGATNISELEEVASYFRQAPLTPAQVDKVRQWRPKVSAQLLNPANWS